MEMDLPEENEMFKEKLALEYTEDQSDALFEPAKLTEPTRPEDLLIHIEL